MAEQYKGISFPFRFGASGGVATSKLSYDDFSRIEESIRQIVFTTVGERIYKAEFGTELRHHMFEVNGDITDMAILGHKIKQALMRFEDRIEVLNVKVYTSPTEDSTMYIEVDAKIIKFQRTETFKIPVVLPQ